jgi:hypothetical protein
MERYPYPAPVPNQADAVGTVVKGKLGNSILLVAIKEAIPASIESNVA